MDTLDDTWMKQFEDYNDFYTDDVFCINLNLIYINRENEIEKIKEEKFILPSPNILTKDDLVSIIKRNSHVGHKEYYLYSLVKFNIDLDPNEVQCFLKETKDSFSETFLTENNQGDEIVFKKTINMFQDLNDVVFLLREKAKVVKPCNRFTRKNR
jgi:hypothetical protein